MARKRTCAYPRRGGWGSDPLVSAAQGKPLGRAAGRTIANSRFTIFEGGRRRIRPTRCLALAFQTWRMYHRDVSRWHVFSPGIVAPQGFAGDRGSESLLRYLQKSRGSVWLPLRGALRCAPPAPPSTKTSVVVLPFCILARSLCLADRLGIVLPPASCAACGEAPGALSGPCAPAETGSDLSPAETGSDLSSEPPRA